uniref:Alternative protein PZP n=1 Tax=Homo sapiens TaxID=9606 RepID=L8EC98_HUMAN|nr:alternative protein PZP [Homo sapiens]
MTPIITPMQPPMSRVLHSFQSILPVSRLINFLSGFSLCIPTCVFTIHG